MYLENYGVDEKFFLTYSSRCIFIFIMYFTSCFSADHHEKNLRKCAKLNSKYGMNVANMTHDTIMTRLWNDM